VSHFLAKGASLTAQYRTELLDVSHLVAVSAILLVLICVGATGGRVSFLVASLANRVQKNRANDGTGCVQGFTEIVFNTHAIHAKGLNESEGFTCVSRGVSGGHFYGVG